jgi:hypothetical protein
MGDGVARPLSGAAWIYGTLRLALDAIGAPLLSRACRRFGLVRWLANRGPSMRLPFLDPSRDEITATATELIMRFGLRARAEAARLAELSAQSRSRRDRLLYTLVGREIEASFIEAHRRLGLRRGALDAERPRTPPCEERKESGEPTGDAAEPPELNRLVPRAPSVSRAVDVPASLVADLSLVDLKPSPRRQFGQR